MSQAQQAVNEVHGLIEQISHGMQEQLQGVSQINQAVSDMDTMTQQNAALVEEVAASASQLTHRAESVANSVGVFQLGDDPRVRVDAVALRKAAKAVRAPEAAAPAHMAPATRATARAPEQPAAAAAAADDGWDTF
jgi:aerotaxis receptor